MNALQFINTTLSPNFPKLSHNFVYQFSSLSFLFFLLISACEQQPKESTRYQCPMKCEGVKTYGQPGTCPICKMDLAETDTAGIAPEEDSTPSNESWEKGNPDGISGLSIFNLTGQWKTQNNETIQFIDLKGDILVMVMVYTSCQTACPRLMADMRNIHSQVADQSVKYVLISIDPEVDTPERLKKVAMENQMDSDQWIFLQGTEDNVREFANVVAMKYKRISPLDFSHSNIISVFDQQGVLFYQQEGLGVENHEIIARIAELKK